MERIFNFDNQVWTFIGKLWDILLLSVLWLIFSLPVITIGASTTALYYTALKLASDQDGYTIASYWQAFRDNFKQGTLMWLLMAALGIFLGTDLYFYFQMKSSVGTVLFCSFLILAVIYLMILTYLFPLLARCKTGLKQIFVMAFIMAAKNFGWTLLLIVTAVCLILLGVFVMAPLLIPVVGLIAFLQSFIFNFIFKQYQLQLDW